MFYPTQNKSTNVTSLLRTRQCYLISNCVIFFIAHCKKKNFFSKHGWKKKLNKFPFAVDRRDNVISF